MVVQHNLTAINANRYFGINNNKLSKSLEKLSSGYAINRAGDNAAGLAVSEKMRAQIAGINQGVKNAQDGISMVQTYEGALTETDSILQRMKTLATQAANGTYDNSVDRNAIQKEFDQLNDELNQIADTDFNGVVALNGGTMADGTRAVGGVFDYSSSASKRAAMELNASDFVVGDAKGSITNDEKLTFVYTDDGDGTGTWAASGAVGTLASKDTGGFVYEGFVFSTDTSELVTGDSVTISFTKGADEVKASAANGGYTIKGFAADPCGAVTVATVVPSSKEDADLINSLQGAEIALKAGTDGKIAAQTSGACLTLADGTSINASADGAATAANRIGITVAENGAIEIYGWINGASTKILSTAAGTASAANKSTNGSIKLSFADAVYQPAEVGGYKIEGGVNASTANANRASTAKLTYANEVALQVGARTKDLVNFTFAYDCDDMGKLEADLNCTAKGLGTDKLSLATQEEANRAIDEIGYAINKVSMVRGTFGAIQNRLEHKIDNLNVTSENLTSAESRIRDTNMAEEMMNFTKNQILSQASQSMLAQANQLPQGVLSLLQ